MRPLTCFKLSFKCNSHLNKKCMRHIIRLTRASDFPCNKFEWGCVLQPSHAYCNKLLDHSQVKYLLLNLAVSLTLLCFQPEPTPAFQMYADLLCYLNLPCQHSSLIQIYLRYSNVLCLQSLLLSLSFRSGALVSPLPKTFDLENWILNSSSYLPNIFDSASGVWSIYPDEDWSECKGSIELSLSGELTGLTL